MAEAHLFCKVIRCGDRVEVVTYSNGILCGNERTTSNKKRSPIDEELEQLEKREDNLYRARRNLRHLIWCNETRYTKFVTLTYAKTVLDTNKVRRDITTFVQAMRRKGYTMNYVYVLENQIERGKKEGNAGCLHVHMLIFNDEKIPLEMLNTCWKHGQTDIKALRHVKNVGAYVCKYITKQGIAAFGQYSYGCSKGLKRPDIECFYTEGFTDTLNLQNPIHPKDIIAGLDVSFHSQMHHDFRDSDGVGRSQTVNYYQGTWKEKDLIEENRDFDEI